MIQKIYYLAIVSILVSCNAKKNENWISKKLDVKPSVFTINPNKDTIIECDKGTLIYIERKSFINTKGLLIKDSVKLEIKEYYNKASIITQALTTITNKGKVLMTGGMVNIIATSNNDTLDLERGKEILIHFPKKTNKSEMSLFSGIPDSSGNIVWKEEQTSSAKLKDDIITWYTKYDNLDEVGLYQQNGENFYEWIRENLVLTENEKEYFLYKDINLYYTLNKNGVFENVHFKQKILNSIEKRLLKVMEKLPLCKPYKVNGQLIDMPGHIALGVKVIPPGYASNETYLKAINEKMIKNKNGKISTLNKLELNYYIFNSNKLGWLNCDAFVNEKPLVNIVVEIENPTFDMVRFIMKDYKSVITGSFNNGKYYFNNIPKNKSINLVVIRYKNDKVFVGFKEIVSDNIEIKNIQLKEIKLEELKMELDKLN